jgi:Taurine catabolism dioxygenase TauD, TfdA family
VDDDAVIFDIHGSPRIFFVGWYIRDAQRHDKAPRLTAQQLDALDLLEGIANDPSFYLQMAFQPGDIQLLNNARILHAREAYTDYDEPTEHRHLLRLWLTAHAFASVEDMLRGGIPARQEDS